MVEITEPPAASESGSSKVNLARKLPGWTMSSSILSSRSETGGIEVWLSLLEYTESDHRCNTLRMLSYTRHTSQELWNPSVVTG